MAFLHEEEDDHKKSMGHIRRNLKRRISLVIVAKFDGHALRHFSL